MKRIFFFLLTNICILVVVSIILNILGVSANPHEFVGLLVFSAVVGCSGSIISLLMSKWLAKRSVGAYVITQQRNETETWLVRTINHQAKNLNLPCPEIAIYDANEPNAFATGPSRNNSLVAVSTGLLQSMTQNEVEAVLAHEMSHIANGDMVTMTLIQGVLNTFVIFFARIAASALSKNSNSRHIYFLVSLVLQVVFGCLASLVVMWFSRQREYRADAGAAKLVGAHKMIAALQRLGQPHVNGRVLPTELSAMSISGGKDSLFSTHPTLENRIARLRSSRLGEIR